ncbi:MAG: SDR family oxidoreductase [Steroidobacteraceae bacterium]
MTEQSSALATQRRTAPPGALKWALAYHGHMERMDRRSALTLTGMALAATLLQDTASAGIKPLRVLILGGTGFIGPHFVTTLNAHGHQVTLFNRGKRQSQPPAGVESLLGDRNGQLDALRGRDWDVVIDDSGYIPRQVQASAELLQGHARHYLFVSSISAYADLGKPGTTENAPLATLTDPTTEKVDEQSYGGLKALCEQAVERSWGEHCAVIRPTYIVGPGDTTDRFTYWPVRVARGGDLLAPGTARDPIQYIDVRDLADFMCRCAERQLAGRYNLCNPPGAVTMGQLLDTCRKVAHSDARFVWASTAFLEREKLLDSGELPIWAPPSGESAGFAQVSCARAVRAGLKFRSLRTTVADTLSWHRRRPAEQQARLRAGLSSEREQELLQKLHNG